MSRIKAPVTSFEELDQDLAQTNEEIAGLEESLKENRAADLTRIITTGGKGKGELQGLTRKQYRDLTGGEPSPKLLTKIEGGTTEKIPWHLVLDQLAGERGYHSDEDLKEAVEKAADDKARVDSLKARRDQLISDINRKRQAKPDIETVKLTGTAPVTKDDTKQEVTEVDGLEIKSTRQPSYWRVESSQSPEKVAIRLAPPMRKLVKLIAKEHIDTIAPEFKLHTEAKRTRAPRMAPVRLNAGQTRTHIVPMHRARVGRGFTRRSDR